MSEKDEVKDLVETDNRVVRKSNILTEAKLNFTVNEAKFLDTLIAEHRDDHPEDRDYEFHTRDLLRDFELGDENHSKLKQMTDSIQSKVTSIKEGGKDKRVNILYHCTYHDGGLITTRFHPEVMPYVKNLKSFYSQYYLSNTRVLSSIYSVRTYQLLKQYEKIGEREFKVEEFRELINVAPTKYKQYSDFKKRVLDPASEEVCEKTDIFCTYKEGKIGKKVVKLIFTITANKNNRGGFEVVVGPDDDAIEGEFTVLDPGEIIDILSKEFGVHKNSGKSLVKKYDEDRILRNIKYVRELVKQGKKPKNLGGFTKTSIENDYAENAQVNDVPVEVEPAKVDAREVVEDLRQELESSITKKIDAYIDDAGNIGNLDVYLAEFFDTDEGSGALKLAKPALRKKLVSEIEVGEKIESVRSVMAMFAAFRLFLRAKVLAPADMDLVLFAKSKGVKLKRAKGGSADYEVE